MFWPAWDPTQDAWTEDSNPGTVCLRSLCTLTTLKMPTLYEKRGIDKDRTEQGVDHKDRQDRLCRQQEPLHLSHRTMARDIAKLRSDGVKKFSILNSRETRDRVELANKVNSWAPSTPLFLCPCGSPLFFLAISGRCTVRVHSRSRVVTGLMFLQ